MVQDYFRALVVDDSTFMRSALKKILKEHGITPVIEECIDGHEAFLKFAEFKPDLVLMDLIMPNMDGLKATKLIHSLDPTVKIVVVTNSKDNSQKQQVLKYGACDYIRKPFDTNEFAKKLTKILMQKTQEDGRREKIKKLNDSKYRIDR